MTTGAWMLIGVCLCMTGGAGMILLWCWKTGQFDDAEGVKYRMLQDD